MMMMMMVMPPLMTIIRITLTTTITPFPYTPTLPIPISVIRIRALRIPFMLRPALPPLPLPLPLPLLFMLFMPALQLMPYNSTGHSPNQRRRWSMSNLVPCKPANRRTEQRRPDIFCPVMVTDARVMVGALFAGHATAVPTAT
jgi:hypothetical protein